MREIERAARGESPTLQSAQRANEIIDALNVLINARISPGIFGEIKDEPGARVFDLSNLAEYIDTRIEEKFNQLVDNELGISAVCDADGTLTVTLTRG